MQRLERKLETPAAAKHSVSLCYTERVRSRLRVVLDDGSEAGLFLPRGTVLHHGDVLGSSDGLLQVRVIAAIEDLYEVQSAALSDDPDFDLVRAAYHLGNRHVPVQLESRRLVLERDPVLRDLLLRLGLQVVEVRAAFEPESGAYGGGHRHDHDPAGGSLGELLSQQAHAKAVPDFAGARFLPAR